MYTKLFYYSKLPFYTNYILKNILCQIYFARYIFVWTLGV
jgi:hypothetical protein